MTVLVAAVGERPMETFRVASEVRPREVHLFHTSQSVKHAGALESLLRSRLEVGAVRLSKVEPFVVPDVGELLARGQASGSLGAPDEAGSTLPMVEGVAIAATGGTKPMLWGVQRWYDSLDPDRRAGSYAVDEARGAVVPTDQFARSRMASSSHPLPLLTLADVGSLHGIRVSPGQVATIMSEEQFRRCCRKVCENKPWSRTEGTMLERLVFQRLCQALPRDGQWHLNPSGITDDGSRAGRKFELDILRCYEGRIWVLECKLGSLGFEEALQDLAEVDLRARQLGGADARAAMLMFSPEGSTKGQDRANQLNAMEYMWVWGRPQAFGSDDLKELLDCGGPGGLESVGRSRIGEFFAT